MDFYGHSHSPCYGRYSRQFGHVRSAIAQSDIGPQAVMLATIAGSNIPDIDTVLKLRNNAKYIRNHRGITHSIPAVILWSFLISGISFAFFSDAPYLHLLLWSFIAVFLHVFVDIFNAYGTQALRPFTKMGSARHH